MRIAQHYGKPFYAANGIGQGDPLSMRFINGAGQMWVNAMKVNFADLRLGVYVDDRSIRAKTKRDLEVAMEMIVRLDACLGQELNVPKSYGMATTRRARRSIRGIKVGGTAIRYAQDARSLGAHIVTTKHKKKAMTKERVSRAAQALKRVRTLRIPRRASRLMPAAVGITKAIFGTSITGIPTAMLKGLRTKVIQAAMGHKKPHAAPELITTLLLNDRSDPGIASDQAAILTVKRLTQRDPGVVRTINEVLQLRGGGSGRNG